MHGKIQPFGYLLWFRTLLIKNSLCINTLWCSHSFFVLIFFPESLTTSIFYRPESLGIARRTPVVRFVFDRFFFCSPLGETIEAQKHDEVSMLFSDIVGFTSICSTASPLTVIDMLQDLYTKFDAFCGFLDIYKVSFLRLLVNIRRASNDDGWSR